jgi:hypothetical protein
MHPANFYAQSLKGASGLDLHTVVCRGRTQGYRHEIASEKDISNGEGTLSAAAGAPGVASAAAAGRDAEPRLAPLDEIACDGCGRSVMSTDGPGLIEVIVGPCPDCGGAFRLVRIAGTRVASD